MIRDADPSLGKRSATRVAVEAPSGDEGNSISQTSNSGISSSYTIDVA